MLFNMRLLYMNEHVSRVRECVTTLEAAPGLAVLELLDLSSIGLQHHPLPVLGHLEKCLC